jgi:hypothetical protein
MLIVNIFEGDFRIRLKSSNLDRAWSAATSPVAYQNVMIEKEPFISNRYRSRKLHLYVDGSRIVANGDTTVPNLISNSTLM